MPQTMPQRFQAAIAGMPVVAILRGVEPDEVVEIAQAILDVGIRVIEVPLNSPQPLASIRKLVEHFGSQAVIGAGTVLSVSEVEACHEAGAQIIVSPNTEPEVIRATVAAGMVSLPGCLTPTEAFTALSAGANAIKLFPGEMVSAATVKAMRAVLPKSALVFVVGGVSTALIPAYREAGADGFGVGGSIYKAGFTADKARASAAEFAAALT